MIKVSEQIRNINREIKSFYQNAYYITEKYRNRKLRLTRWEVVADWWTSLDFET